jgi:hypothetical protein
MKTGTTSAQKRNNYSLLSLIFRLITSTIYLKKTNPIKNEAQLIVKARGNNDLKLLCRVKTNKNHSTSTTKTSKRIKFVIRIEKNPKKVFSHKI